MSAWLHCKDAEQQNRLAQARLIEMATRGRLAHDLIAQQEEELAREAESLAAERTRLDAHLQQVRDGQAPIHEVRDACALLKDGMLEAGPAEKKYLINLLVEVIYADREGWDLQGYLPGLEASGTFDEAAIGESRLRTTSTRPIG